MTGVYMLVEEVGTIKQSLHRQRYLRMLRNSMFRMIITDMLLRIMEICIVGGIIRRGK